MKLEQEIRAILNKHSRENKSNTPDHILAWFLMDCLRAWEYATNWREEYYGRKTAHPIRSQFQFDETSKMTLDELKERGIDKPPIIKEQPRLGNFNIGQFALSRHTMGGVFITRCDGEGGTFNEESLEAVITEFYERNF